MNKASLTPITVIEDFFKLELNNRAIRHLCDLPKSKWVEFAGFYKSRMKEGFVAEYLQVEDQRQVRLYFEPKMALVWEDVTILKYGRTPIIGRNGYPDDCQVTKEYVSSLVNPLKKHLLLADSVYIRDHFYYCFDGIADNPDLPHWEEVNRIYLEMSLQAIKRWLPILLGLRVLIDSKALVFMPYYVTPTFPYGNVSEDILNKVQGLLSIPRDPSLVNPRKPIRFDFSKLNSKPAKVRYRKQPYFDTEATLLAWTNARLMGLDPVFPNQKMLKWANGIKVEGDVGGSGVSTDLMSVNMLPFGDGHGITLKDLCQMRKNEAGFAAVRDAMLKCRTYIEENVGKSSSERVLTNECKAVLHDELAKLERKSVVSLLNDKPALGMLYTFGVGAALLTSPPLAALLVSAGVAPPVLNAIASAVNPKKRALGHLNALL